METLQTEIYNHDSDIDVTHKINSIELDNWINHLKYIKKELNNLIGLYGEDLSSKLDDESILQKFQKKGAENDLLLKALHPMRYDLYNRARDLPKKLFVSLG